MTESLAPIVAQHYNKLEEKGLDVRKQCRIVYMRNFNNWIKSMLIREFCDKNKDNADIKVLDIGAGKGGDLMKWKKGNINYLVCADIAETSVEQCNERYNEMKQRHKKQRERGNCFDAEFIVADCTKDRLKDKYKDSSIQFDIVSCQFAFHYCFESITQAKTMLQNISECLKPGGFFIGTLPDAYDIMRRLEETDGCVFGNDVYTVTFLSKEQPSIFGAKYDFHLEDCVDCPEFLVYFPVFLKLAEEFGLDLVYCKRFEEYFQEKLKLKDGMFLLQRMLALETYPPNSEFKPLMGCDDEYYYAKEEIKSLVSDKEGNEQVGTLSQSEWEVICMYCVFAFVKKGTEDD